MRRLPIYILIDMSGSMKGEPIESVKVGLADMIATLRGDPYALETVSVSVITYAHEPKIVLPLTRLENLQMPDIEMPESGPKHLGAALKLFTQRVGVEIKKDTPGRKGDWKPILVLFTSGKVSDIMDYNRIVPTVKSLNLRKIVAFLPSLKAKTEQMRSLTDLVYNLDIMDASVWRNIFYEPIIDPPIEQTLYLPAPPEEVNIII